MKRTVRRIGCVSLLLALPILALPAVAQDPEDINTGGAVTNTTSGKVGFGVTLTGSEQFNSDVDHGGAFSLFRGAVAVGVPVKINDEFGVDTKLRYQFDNYQFSKQFDLWGTINTVTLASLLRWRLDEQWSVYGGPAFRFSYEDSTDMNNGFTAAGIVGFNYVVNSNLTLGAGVAYVGQIENSSRVLPIITADWMFADNWRLKAGFIDVATTGYGAEVVYAIAPQWTVGAGAQYHSSRFRLRNDRPSTDPTDDGIGQETSGTLFLRVGWKPTQYVSLSAFAGVVTGGSLRLEDKHGHIHSGGTKVGFDENYDTTGMAGGEFSVHF